MNNYKYIKGINLFLNNFGNFGTLENFPGNSSPKYYNFYKISQICNTEQMFPKKLLKFELEAVARVILHIIFYDIPSELFEEFLNEKLQNKEKYGMEFIEYLSPLEIYKQKESQFAYILDILSHILLHDVLDIKVIENLIQLAEQKIKYQAENKVINQNCTQNLNYYQNENGNKNIKFYLDSSKGHNSTHTPKCTPFWSYQYNMITDPQKQDLNYEFIIFDIKMLKDSQFKKYNEIDRIKLCRIFGLFDTCNYLIEKSFKIDSIFTKVQREIEQKIQQEADKLNRKIPYPTQKLNYSNPISNNKVQSNQSIGENNGNYLQQGDNLIQQAKNIQTAEKQVIKDQIKLILADALYLQNIGFQFTEQQLQYISQNKSTILSSSYDAVKDESVQNFENYMQIWISKAICLLQIDKKESTVSIQNDKLQQHQNQQGSNYSLSPLEEQQNYIKKKNGKSTEEQQKTIYFKNYLKFYAILCCQSILQIFWYNTKEQQTSLSNKSAFYPINPHLFNANPNSEQWNVAMSILNIFTFQYSSQFMKYIDVSSLFLNHQENIFFKIKIVIHGAQELVFDILSNHIKDHFYGEKIWGILYTNYIQKTIAMSIDRKQVNDAIQVKINVKEIEDIINQTIKQYKEDQKQKQQKIQDQNQDGTQMEIESEEQQFLQNPFETYPSLYQDKAFKSLDISQQTNDTQQKQAQQQNKYVNLKIFGIQQYEDIHWPIDLGFLLERLSLEQTGVQNTQSIASKYAIISLRIRRRYLGGKAIETANSLNTLGNCLYYMNKVHYSIVYIQEACNILLNFLGNLHQEVATNFNNIAFLLSSTGKIHESLKFHDKALKIRQKCFGEIHNEVALSYNNLAMSYSRLQQLDKCKTYQLKCISIWNQVWQGEPHPNIATGYNNLATNETFLQNYEQALIYHLKAYNIRKAFFQDQLTKNEYPQDIIVSIDGIGLTCMKLEKIEEALQYQKQALYRWLKLKGKNHNYGISLNNISQTLKRDNKWEKAFFLMKVAYQKLYEKLGENNANVKNARTNFSSTKAETLKSNSTTERIISNLCEQIEREVNDFNFFNLRLCLQEKEQEETIFGLVLDYIFGRDYYLHKFLFKEIDQQLYNQLNRTSEEYHIFIQQIKEGNPKFYTLMEQERNKLSKQTIINSYNYSYSEEEIINKLFEMKCTVDKSKNLANKQDIKNILDLQKAQIKQKPNIYRGIYWKYQIDKQFLGTERLWQEKEGQIYEYKQNPRFYDLQEKVLIDIENRIVEHLTDIDPFKPLPCDEKQLSE